MFITIPILSLVLFRSASKATVANVQASGMLEPGRGVGILFELYHVTQLRIFPISISLSRPEHIAALPESRLSNPGVYPLRGYVGALLGLAP